MTGVGAKIAGQTVLTGGEGAFAIFTDGIAGFVSGNASVAAGGVEVGGRVLLRVNTTGRSVDRTVTVGGRDPAILFGEGEGSVFQISIASASINIADTVFVEGSVTFGTAPSLGAGISVFAGTGLTVFVGDGPLTLENGDRNPLARGIVLRDATIGVIKSATGDYAVDARGTIELVGFRDVTAQGTARVRANSFAQGWDTVLTIPGTDLEVPVVFTADEQRDGTTGAAFISAGGVGLQLRAFGQLLAG